MLETWGFRRLLGKHSEKGARLLSYELLVWVNGKEKDHTMIRSLESEKTPLVLFHVINTLVLHVCWNKTHKHVADSNERDMQCDAMDAAGRFYGPNTWRVMSTVVCLCTYLPYTYLPAYHPTTCAYY